MIKVQYDHKNVFEGFSNNNDNNYKINEMPGKLTNIKYKINLLSRWNST